MSETVEQQDGAEAASDAASAAVETPDADTSAAETPDATPAASEAPDTAPETTETVIGETEEALAELSLAVDSSTEAISTYEQITPDRMSVAIRYFRELDARSLAILEQFAANSDMDFNDQRSKIIAAIAFQRIVGTEHYDYTIDGIPGWRTIAALSQWADQSFEVEGVDPPDMTDIPAATQAPAPARSTSPQAFTNIGAAAEGRVSNNRESRVSGSPLDNLRRRGQTTNGADIFSSGLPGKERHASARSDYFRGNHPEFADVSAAAQDIAYVYFEQNVRYIFSFQDNREMHDAVYNEVNPILRDMGLQEIEQDGGVIRWGADHLTRNLPLLDRMQALYDKARPGKNFLVHCKFGAHRAPFGTIAAYMRDHQCTREEAHRGTGIPQDFLTSFIDREEHPNIEDDHYYTFDQQCDRLYEGYAMR